MLDRVWGRSRDVGARGTVERGPAKAAVRVQVEGPGAAEAREEDAEAGATAGVTDRSGCRTLDE